MVIKIFYTLLIIKQVGTMNLARYRLEVAAQNRRRLWGCLAVASLLHGLVWIRPAPQAQSEPIQFVAIGQVRPARLAQRETQRDGQVNLGSAERQPPAKATTQRGATHDAVWGEYLMALRQRIDERRTHQKKTNRPTKVRFILDRQGRLIQSELLQSSGNAAADRVALRAVEDSAPFGQFPDRATEDRLRVTFNFD
jgi:periplasmic protein TonB